MISKRIFAALTLFFLAVAPNLHAAKCSNASLKGTYGYSSQGFTDATPDISPAGFVPFSQTGLIVYDGQGNISSGTVTYATTTAAGGTNSGTFTGNYSVNPDCSGTVLVDLPDGTLFHFDLVVLGPGRHTYINTDAAAGFISVYSFQKIVGEKETSETR